jgi:hypothetical protein|tara:strand:- start:368 stop:520 length:153 start_codon:yes stop_codon:yes gene_type:complete
MDRMERTLNVQARAAAELIEGEKEKDLAPPAVPPKAKKPTAKKKAAKKKS